MTDDPVMVHLPFEGEYIRVPDYVNWGRYVLVRRAEAMQEFNRARRDIIDSMIKNGANWLDMFMFERLLSSIPRSECYIRAAEHIAKNGVIDAGA